MAETNSESAVKLPSVQWAQRMDCLFLTVAVPQAKDLIAKFEPRLLHISCTGGQDSAHYALDIEFYGEINPKNSKYMVLGRNIDMLIQKKEAGPYWPRLTNDKKKQHWLSTDFSRWKDEDDSEDELAGGDDVRLNEMLANMGGGMPGGPGGLGGMEGLNMGDGDEEDSDDEPIPDLEETDPMKEMEGRSE